MAVAMEAVARVAEEVRGAAMVVEVVEEMGEAKAGEAMEEAKVAVVSVVGTAAATKVAARVDSNTLSSRPSPSKVESPSDGRGAPLDT